MTIKKLSEYKGASRFGNCTECGEMESDTHRLYRLQFNGVSICLCTDCFRKTRIAMNEIFIEPQISYTVEEDLNEYMDNIEIIEKRY